MHNLERLATAWAPINIAVLKYWGKRDKALHLPVNDSISVSLDGVDKRLGTMTTVRMTTADQDTMSVSINGVDYTDKVRPKAVMILDALRNAINDTHKYQVVVESINYSPTASGLASSASGYAALTMAMAKCLNVDELQSTDLTSIARLGSGSASRSIHGGFVHWHAGQLADGADSVAAQLAPHDYWPELCCLIVRFKSVGMKSVSSTEGMQRSRLTSRLMAAILTGMPDIIDSFTRSIKAKDFDTFATLTMKDSNQLHAICLDTFPPINYLNEDSWRIINRVHELNAAETVAAYTFDAGPHPVLFFERPNLTLVKSAISELALDAELIECKVSEGSKYI